VPIAFAFPGTSQLRVGVRCVDVCIHGATLQRVIAVLYSASVTVSDPVAPDASAIGGAIANGGWLRGTTTASFSASDATGIDVLELRRGGTVVASDDRSCDFARPAPCASPGTPVAAAWGPIDTSTWPDGTHPVTARATDAGQNPATSAAISVQVDNTPPAAPSALAATGGGDWSAAAARTLSWTLPAESGVAPVVAGRLELCRIGGGCLSADTDSTTGHSLSLTTPGTYEARVSVRDAAGNIDTSGAAVTTLRYDPDAPPAPTLGAPAHTERTFTVPVSLADPGPAPVTRLEGVLCESSGSGCRPAGTTTDVSSFSVTVPGPGTWRLNVSARDAAGNLGPAGTRDLVAATPSPTPQASPSPTATPNPARTLPRMRFTRARRTGRSLRVIASVPRDVTGRFEVRYRVRVGRRTTTYTLRNVRARSGRVSVNRVLPARMRSARTGRLELRFAGDARYLPRRIARTVRHP
jgi:hypothetical protein